MTSATVDTSKEAGQTNVCERLVDTCGQMAHLSHEARLLTLRATDAVEEGRLAAKRAMTSIQRRVEDLTDEAAYQVKRRPLKVVALVLGAGLVVGLAAGWIGRRTLRAGR